MPIIEEVGVLLIGDRTRRQLGVDNRGVYRLRKNIIADGVGFQQRPGTVELFKDLRIPCRVAEIKEKNTTGTFLASECREHHEWEKSATRTVRTRYFRKIIQVYFESAIRCQ